MSTGKIDNISPFGLLYHKILLFSLILMRPIKSIISSIVLFLVSLARLNDSRLINHYGYAIHIGNLALEKELLLVYDRRIKYSLAVVPISCHSDDFHGYPYLLVYRAIGAI
jgi:hypothetical protein